MVTNNQIAIIAKIIGETVDAESIYLFGSYAKGQPNDNSDVDIAVIKNTIQDKHEELFQIRSALSFLGIPMDILLFDKNAYQNKVNIFGTVQYEIAHKGKKLA